MDTEKRWKMKRRAVAVFILFLIVTVQIMLLFGALSGTAYSIENTENLNVEKTVSDIQKEHIRFVADTQILPMEIYADNGEHPVKTVMASDYIPLSPCDNVNILFSIDAVALAEGECYVYFYNREKQIIWDIFDYLDEATGERNRISAQELKALNGFQFSNIADAAYVRIAPANDYSCQLLIWDGQPEGYPITANAQAFDSDRKKQRLPENATFSIQVPDSAQYLIAMPGYTFTGMVQSSETERMAAHNSLIRFPAQIVDLRNLDFADCPKNVNTVRDYDYATGEASRDMPNGDLSAWIVAVDERDYQTLTPGTTVDREVMERINACMDFVWEAKAGVGNFKVGITYHGIPYRSSWLTAHYVGWHVSKQTFMNAANDPDSIFYHTQAMTNLGPYYSLVCSSFASLVYGMEYPNLVFGLEHDPNNTVRIIDKPAVGVLMTNGKGHCYIPVGAMSNASGKTVYTVAEQIGPLTAIRNIFPDIPDDWKGIGPKTTYATDYVYAVTHPEFVDVPYDINEYKIKNGSARPFRGDQSVYTSAMDVLINIKDPEATRLCFQEFEVECEHGMIKHYHAVGKPKYVRIQPDTKQVNLRSATVSGIYSGAALKNGGIYGVWASVGDRQKDAPDNVEFFEWYDLDKESINYMIAENTLFTNDEFWYVKMQASCDDPSMPGSAEGGFVIPYVKPNSNGVSDYSRYSERIKLAAGANSIAFFRKGQLGAYVASKQTFDEEPGSLE